MWLRAATALLTGLIAAPGAAQDPFPDTVQTCTAVTGRGLPGIAGLREDYVRAVSLRADDPADVLIRRPSHRSHPATIPCDGPWRLAANDTGAARPVAVSGSLDAVFNSGYPSGMQTGLLWPGRGVHVLWTVGADYRVGPLQVGLYPQVAYQQNRDFTMFPFPGDSASPFAYPWARSATGRGARIDWPQRHGDESFWSASLGQSFLSLEAAGIRAGVSTENLWWGPAVRNSILLGNDAGGFPHVFLGTPRGLRTLIGRVAAELVWGRLTESDYFNFESDDDHRFFSGIIVSFQPRGATGLSIGGARLYYQPYDEIGLGDLLPFLESPFKNDLATPENPAGDDVADQMVALYARYAIPRTGFEVYAEWARNDHSAHIRDFYAEPDHSRAYTLGFQQIVPVRERWFRLRGEITQLGVTRTATVRVTPTYYVHHLVPQGHTHRGQLLGASIGPGSESQFLGFDMFTTRGSHGLFLQRIRHNEDAFHRFIAATFRSAGHDVELTGGTTHLLRLGPLDVVAGFTYSSRRNRTFRHCNPTVTLQRDCRLPPFRDRNVQVPVGLAWRIH